MASDAFLRRPEPPRPGKELAGLLRAVRNAALNEVNRADSDHVSFDEVTDRPPSPAPAAGLELEGKELRRQVEEALAELDDVRAATVYRLVNLQGMPPAEAADVFDVGPDRIGQLRRKARRELRSILGDDFPL